MSRHLLAGATALFVSVASPSWGEDFKIVDLCEDDSKLCNIVDIEGTIFKLSGGDAAFYLIKDFIRREQQAEEENQGVQGSEQKLFAFDLREMG